MARVQAKWHNSLDHSTPQWYYIKDFHVLQVFVPWETEHIQIAKPTAPGVLILIVFTSTTPLQWQ